MLLEGIETLLMLSKVKTMNRTGSQLYISQSAVSKRISNLEKKLGKKLIVPDGRNVQLTQEALNLIESISPTFNELRGRIYDQQSIKEQSLLYIDCSETLVASYLAKIFGEHFKSDPHISIKTNHTPRIIEHVESGQAHIGICAGSLPPQHRLKTFHLLDEPFVIVSHQMIQTLPNKIITNDLSNPANCYQLKLLKNLNIQPIMEMDSYTAAAQLALAGIAPALVPLSVVETLKIDKQNCCHFSQLKPLSRPINICIRASSYKNQRIQILVDKVCSLIN